MESFLVKMVQDVRQERGVIVQLARSHVEVRIAFCGVALAIAGHVDRSRDGESEELLDTALPGGFEEPLLTSLLRPVVGAIRILERLAPTPRVGDIGRLPLLCCPRADIEAPK